MSGIDAFCTDVISHLPLYNLTTIIEIKNETTLMKVDSNKPAMMKKSDRRNMIVQLIEQSDQKQMLGTRQLAEHLGVSEMTVRRDLHELSQRGLLSRQHGGAGPARSLLESQRNEIGILLISRTGKYSDPFFNAVLEGVDRKLQDLDYRIAYINTHTEVNTAEQAHALFQSAEVKGFILVGPPLGDEAVEYLQATTHALVIVAGSIGGNYDVVTFDGFNGIKQMVDHLVEKGFRRPAYVAGHVDARQQGFVAGLLAHDLPMDPELQLIIPSGIDGWTSQLGHLAAQQLMQLPTPPDAIICASDLIAIGAIKWLHENKFRVPEDVAVTGFDNIAESAFTVPSLTTVNVHKQLIGAWAAERVIQRIENEDEIPVLIQTPTQLVIRHSSGG